MATEIIRQPEVSFANLTSEMVARIGPDEAEKLVIGFIAQLAHVREGGKILSFSEFNENPDILVNRLLAKILLHQVDKPILESVPASQIAVLSIENSASYLATQVAEQIESMYNLNRPPRIIRARKSQNGTKPSPAMGEVLAIDEVFPITSSGQPRTIVGSVSSTTDLSEITVLIVVDDFRATGDTLRGGVKVGIGLLEQSGVDMSQVTIVPLAGLGKPQQSQSVKFPITPATITDVYTAVDVRFWADKESGLALIQANGFPPHMLHNATIEDFN